MPRKYKRKIGAQPRVVTWTENSLAVAIEEMKDNRLSINDIARRHGIPPRTLRRRFTTQNNKIIPLGKHPTLGYENERRLVAHIQKLERSGFPPDRKTVRALAFQLAEMLKIKHNFNTETKMAGTNWLQNFLERNPILSIKQAESPKNLSPTSAPNKEENTAVYDLQTKILEEDDLFDKPDRIFNMDETDVQLDKKEDNVEPQKMEINFETNFTEEHITEDPIGDTDEPHTTRDYVVNQTNTTSDASSSIATEGEAFGRTVGLQLNELQPTQRYMAEKLISEVIYCARFEKLSATTKLSNV